MPAPTLPKFRRVIPLSHGIDDVPSQQAVRQLERAVEELQDFLLTYKAITSSSSTTTSASTVSTIVSVEYTATGGEGVDFMVTIGITMKNSNYDVLWAPEGENAIPVVDLPNKLTTDRTSTQFRVLMNAQVSSGDKITFLLFQK